MKPIDYENLAAMWVKIVNPNILKALKKRSLQIKQSLDDLAHNDCEEAFKLIYFSYCEPITRYILLFTKSKEVTEELLSDVFVTIWENRKTLPLINNFNSYIYKIAKFKSLNYLRRKIDITIDLDQERIDLFAFTKTTAEDEYISKETIESMNAAIEELPPKCKLAFKLVRENDMKYSEAAEHLGISVKTLEGHLTLAIKKLRLKLK